MSERVIFEHLFSIANQSKDTDGVVTSCLVRDGQIIADAVSAGEGHSEFMLLHKLTARGIEIHPSDILYVTLQPCDRRSTDLGLILGDCTTNTIAAGIKNVVYAAPYPKSLNGIERFTAAGVHIRQVVNRTIAKQAAELFNSTNENTEKHLPVPN